jgi:hypothetical protein
MDRFPEGQEPKPENLYKPDHDEASWRKVLCQDFSNMGNIQRGMKSRGFRGSRPSPVQERAVSHFHRTLRRFLEDPHADDALAPEPLPTPAAAG